MSTPGPTIDLAVTTPCASGATALRGVADLLEDRELTPAMGRWIRRLAATFSSWHDAVLRVLETHPALSLTDPSVSVEVPDTYLASIVDLTRGLGPRAGRGDVVPVAVALVELAGAFGPTFASLGLTDPEVHGRLARAADLAPAPFGAAAGLTTQFVDGVIAVAADISASGIAAGAVRSRIDEVDLDTMTAIGHLRRAGSSVHGVAAPHVNDDFDPARVAALAAVLEADGAFDSGSADATTPVDRARRLGPLALAATGDFAAVARTDERIAAGLTVAETAAVVQGSRPDAAPDVVGS